MDLEFRESLLLSQKTLGEVCLLNQVSILKSLLFPRHISSRVLIELGEARYLRHEKKYFDVGKLHVPGSFVSISAAFKDSFSFSCVS